VISSASTIRLPIGKLLRQLAVKISSNFDLVTEKIHPQWHELLATEFSSQYFTDLHETISDQRAQGILIYPSSGLELRVLEMSPQDVQVVIIGQDPYHGPGEAMGLSFSVPRGIKIPPSLRNIYKEIQDDLGHIPPGHGDLSSWMDQGVLLLNSVLTVEHKKPGSHRKMGWQLFTDAIISCLSDHFENIVFMLWGNFAKSKIELINIDRHQILTSAHPSPLAGKKFFGNHHFSQANTYLEQHGKQSIDWSLPLL